VDRSGKVNAGTRAALRTDDVGPLGAAGAESFEYLEQIASTSPFFCRPFAAGLCCCAMRAATNETARIAVALCFVYVLQSLIARMTISESALGLIRNNGPRGWVKESLSRGECFNPSASLCCSAVVSALVSPWHAENMLPGVAGQLMSFIMASTPRGIERWIERMINRSEAQCILLEYCSNDCRFVVVA
jgi:hypothetical protein